MRNPISSTTQWYIEPLLKNISEVFTLYLINLNSHLPKIFYHAYNENTSKHEQIQMRRPKAIIIEFYKNDIKNLNEAILRANIFSCHTRNEIPLL